MNIKALYEANKHSGGIFGAAVAGWIVLASLGVPLPTNAWSTDIDRVERESKAEISRIEQEHEKEKAEQRARDLKSAINDLYDLWWRMLQLTKAGEDVPRFMLDQESDLKILIVNMGGVVPERR